ncbi:MAG TPA: LamG-like jellyroll fold domain-containing protein [Cyclobacteriaceae bacterium]|jgi:hypothetical protein
MRRKHQKLIIGIALALLMLTGCKKDEENTPYLVSLAGLIRYEVSIMGVSFNPDLAENRVFLSNVEAEVTSAEPTLIKFIVPDLPWGIYEVTLISGDAIYVIGNYTILFPVDPIGLGAYYPLNGSAVDLGPLSHRGTEVGDLIYEMDRHGEEGLAASFDGVDDVITTSATLDYEFRTVSFWFYPTNVMKTEKQVIISLDDNVLQYGRVRAEIQAGTLTLWAGGLVSTYSMPVQNNTWYHIALARDPTATGYFINGILVVLGEADGEGETVTPNDNLVIGAGPAESAEYFEGIIDEIIVFNRVLSEPEVEFLGEY